LDHILKPEFPLGRADKLVVVCYFDQLPDIPDNDLGEGYRKKPFSRKNHRSLNGGKSHYGKFYFQLLNIQVYSYDLCH
jgi:hypothetical protein